MDAIRMHPGLALHHLALGAVDLAKSEAFYESLVGLTIQCRHYDDEKRHRSTWFHLGERFVAVERVDVNPQTEICPLALAISADQRSALKERLVRARCPIERETGYTLYVRDPAGNLIGFSHHPISMP